MPLLWLAFPPVFLIAYSMVDPIWVERYALPSLGALVVLAGYGLHARPTRRAPLAGRPHGHVASGGLRRGALVRQPGPRRLRQHSTGDRVPRPARRTRSHSPPTVRVAVEFELRDRAAWGRAGTRVPFGISNGASSGPVSRPATRSADANVEALAASHPRLWVISGFYNHDDEVTTALGRLERAYSLTSRHEFPGRITLYLFLPRRGLTRHGTRRVARRSECRREHRHVGPHHGSTGRGHRAAHRAVRT